MSLKQFKDEALGLLRFISLILFAAALTGVLLAAILFFVKVVNDKPMPETDNSTLSSEQVESTDYHEKAVTMFDEVVTGSLSSQEGLDLANLYIQAIDDEIVSEAEFLEIEKAYARYKEKATSPKLE